VPDFTNIAVVSAVASSTFLTFCVPSSPLASTRNTVGSYVVALLVTLALSPFAHDPVFPVLLDHEVVQDALAAVAVGLTMLLMAVTNTEHAPAAGIALGLSLQPWTLEASAAILAMVALLAVVQVAARGRLVDML